MCRFFSCLIKKNGDVVYGMTDSHEDLIQQEGLSDNTNDPSKMLFARLEITPDDGNIFNNDFSKWSVHIDQTITPEWLTDNMKAYCKEILAEVYSKRVFLTGKHQVVKGIYYAGGDSTVKACGDSTVKACGDSTVEAWDNSTVEACGNSTVKARGNSTVKACGNSIVDAWDNSTVEAWGNSTVNLYSGNCQVRANAKCLDLTTPTPKLIVPKRLKVVRQ
jgi:hypothetical protein